HSIITAGLFERDGVVIGRVQRVKELFECRITFNRKKYFVLTTEEKISIVHERRLIIGNLNLYHVARYSSGSDRRRSIGVIKGITPGQRYSYLIFLRPRKVKVDRVLP